MQLVHLQVFLAVVREGSFAGAAKSLWLSPSRVTERVQQLEKELRVTLIDRSTRQLLPTQAGRALLPRAQAMIRELDLIRALFPVEDGISVRVGMRSVPTDFRERVQHEMENAVGRENLTVLPLDPATQLQLLLSGNLDCGLLWDSAPPPLRSMPILSETLSVALPVHERFASLDVVHPADLAGLRLVSVSDPNLVPSPGLRPYLDHLPHVDLINPAVANATYVLVSGGKHCAFAGTASTAHHALSDEMRRNILIKPLADPAPEMVTHFAWRPELEESPAFASLLEQMRRRFPEIERR